MRLLRLLPAALLLGALGSGAAAAGPALPPPDLVLSAGGTFGANSSPSSGGVSLALSAIWPVEPRVRAGLRVFADDIGTAFVDLADPNNGTPLGPAANVHRWTWGAAWRAEADVWSGPRWTTGVSGDWGWWRVEDDRRGDVLAAGSAVGLRLGADVRRALSRGRAIGLEVNFQRLTRDRHASWARVDQYTTAALQFRWGARDLHD